MSSSTRRVSLWLVLVMIASLVLAACGNDTGAGTTGQTDTGSAGNTNAQTPTPDLNAPLPTDTEPTAAATTATGGATAGATVAATATAEGQGGAASGAVVTAGATALATGETDGAAGAGGGTETAQCPDTAKGAQLTYWTPFTGPDGKFMEALVSKFNNENESDIQVKMQTQPEYYNKLSAAATSNTLPDVAVIHADQIATMAVRNIIRPLPEEIMGSIGVSEGDFPEAVWTPGEYNGQRYSIPLDIHPLVMYYNENMLKSAGLSGPPTNKEEFEKLISSAKQGDTMGWAVTTGFPIQQMFQTLLYQFGGTAFNEDATQATWNSEAGVRALTYLRDAQQKYSKPNMPVDAGITAFKQGKSAVEWNGIWQIPNLVTPHEFGAGAPIPQIGDQMAVWAGSHQLALTKQRSEDPKKTAAAGCFMDWLSANTALWARGGQIPAHNAVRESQAFKQVQPQATIAPSVESAFFPPAIPGIVDAYAPLDEEIAAVMTGKQKDIKQALDRAAQKANQILQRNAQRYGGNR